MPKTNSHRKSIHLFCESLGSMYAATPRESLLWVVLTLKKGITDPKVANKHFHSFAQCLRKYFSDYIRVVEPQEEGRVHYHLVAVDREQRDLHSGYDTKTHKSSNKLLHRLQRQFRAARKKYPVFGQCQVQPVASLQDTMDYLVDKLEEKRRAGWQGVRLWAPTKGFPVDWRKSRAGKAFKAMDAKLLWELKHNHKWTPAEILVLRADPRKWAYWKLMLMFKHQTQREVIKWQAEFKRHQKEHGREVAKRKAWEKANPHKIRSMASRFSPRMPGPKNTHYPRS